MAFDFPTTSYTAEIGATRKVISSEKPLAAANKRIIGMNGNKFPILSNVGESGIINMRIWITITTIVE
jgi:hypothetical protein